MSHKFIQLAFVVASVFVVVQSVKIELLRDQYGKLGTKFDFYDEEYQNGNYLFA